MTIHLTSSPALYIRIDIHSSPVSVCHPPVIILLLSSHTALCPLYCLSAAANRTKQIAEHVTLVHNASNSQRNNNPNLNHAHQHHCEHRYDYDPVRCPTTPVTVLFVLAFVSHDNFNSPRMDTPTPAR